MTWLTKPLIRLRLMLSRSDTFQALVGTPGDAAGALAFIELESMDGDTPGPRALVGWLPETTHSRVVLNSAKPWETTGRVGWALRVPVGDSAPDQSSAQAIIYFDTLAEIITEIAAQSGLQDTLNVNIMTVAGIDRMEPENRTNGDYYEGWVVCTFRQPK